MIKMSKTNKVVGMALLIIFSGLIIFIVSPLNKFVWDETGTVSSEQKKDEAGIVSLEEQKKEEENYLKELTRIYEGYDEEMSGFEDLIRSANGDRDIIFGGELNSSVSYFLMRLEIYHDEITSLEPPKSLAELHQKIQDGSSSIVEGTQMVYSGMETLVDDEFIDGLDLHQEGVEDLYKNYSRIRSKVNSENE